MFKVDNSTAATALPTPSAAGTPGYFTGGNPGAGVPATILDADFMNMLQEELSNLVTAGGQTLSKTTYNQLALAIQAARTNYALDTGVVNALTASLTPAATTLTDGMVVRILVKVTNTGASTLNLNGIGASPIIGPVGALQGGELVANKPAVLMWVAGLTSWMLMESSGTKQINPAIASNHAVNYGQFAVGSLTDMNISFTLPNGIIVKMFDTVMDSNAVGTTNTSLFPTAFPTGCYGVLVSNGDPITQPSAIVGGILGSHTPSSFGWRSSVAGSNRINVIAIGN